MSGEGIGRGPKGRRDYDSVRTNTAKVFAIHRNLHRKNTGHCAASHNNIVGSMSLAYGSSRMDERPYQHGTGAYTEFTGKKFFKCRLPVVTGQFGKKAYLSKIDTEQRDTKTCQLAGHTDKRTISAEDDG